MAAPVMQFRFENTRSRLACIRELNLRTKRLIDRCKRLLNTSDELLTRSEEQILRSKMLIAKTEKLLREQSRTWNARPSLKGLNLYCRIADTGRPVAVIAP
jgi:hypothetical protein